MVDVREGSVADLNLMLHGAPDVPLDPRVDRAFQVMRGEPEKNVVSLVASAAKPPTDEERAAEHKAALREHAEKICEVMTAARREGVMLSWNIGWDVAGRAFVQSVDAMKPL